MNRQTGAVLLHHLPLLDGYGELYEGLVGAFECQQWHAVTGLALVLLAASDGAIGSHGQVTDTVHRVGQALLAVQLAITTE